jgi:hypothetical protein
MLSRSPASRLLLIPFDRADLSARATTDVVIVKLDQVTFAIKIRVDLCQYAVMAHFTEQDTAYPSDVGISEPKPRKPCTWPLLLGIPAALPFL